MTTTEYEKLTAGLVHAAWSDASNWIQVTAPLRELGLRVRAAQIPLTSLSEDVAALIRLPRQVDGPVLLVAHSYAGAVITAAGADNLQVKAQVYIAAIPTKANPQARCFSVPSRTPAPGRRSLPTRMAFSGCRRVRSQTRWRRTQIKGRNCSDANQPASRRARMPRRAHDGAGLEAH
jgi:pimeloyl-ACP methyl ester carboxylesterase